MLISSSFGIRALSFTANEYIFRKFCPANLKPPLERVARVLGQRDAEIVKEDTVR